MSVKHVDCIESDDPKYDAFDRSDDGSISLLTMNEGLLLDSMRENLSDMEWDDPKDAVITIESSIMLLSELRKYIMERNNIE